jgi:heme oxygenase (biliverdin-IX-beta and delta-forming)
MAMIMTKLKEATREQHEHLEEVVGVMEAAFNREDYGRLLTKFYKFYSSLEPRFDAAGLRVHGYDLDARRKVPSIESDLKSLGIFDKIAGSAGTWLDVPDVASPAEAFGALYVIEGATLGGQIITRHLKQNLGVTFENGGSFFNSYGDRVGPMWKDFCAVTRDFAERHGGEDRIIESARKTFDSFARCFGQSSAAVAQTQ